MNIFDWIAASIVIVTLIYVSFVLTWLIGRSLRKGQAVTHCSSAEDTNGRYGRRVMIIIGLALAFHFSTSAGFHCFCTIQCGAHRWRDWFALVSRWFHLVLWARRTLGKIGD
jgi:hypothetical protein